MRNTMRPRFALLILALAPVITGQTGEQLGKGLQYRSIGPYRGGRMLAVAGVPGEPTFYFGRMAEKQKIPLLDTRGGQ
jgi:hypothetical protein